MADQSLQVQGTGRVAPGIRIRRKRNILKYEASVSSGGKTSYKLFPYPGTALNVMFNWQLRERATLIANTVITSKPMPGFKKTPQLEKSEDGFCYLYVFKCGPYIKIGRSTDPKIRLKQIQTSQPEPVEFVAASPIHASVEPLIHERLKHLRLLGEWYPMHDDVLAVIRCLEEDRNPYRLIWKY